MAGASRFTNALVRAGIAAGLTAILAAVHAVIHAGSVAVETFGGIGATLHAVVDSRTITVVVFGRIRAAILATVHAAFDTIVHTRTIAFLSHRDQSLTTILTMIDALSRSGQGETGLQHQRARSNYHDSFHMHTSMYPLGNVLRAKPLRT